MIVLVSGDRRDEDECRATTRAQGAEGGVREPKERRARTATEGGGGGRGGGGREAEEREARGGGWERQEVGEDDGEVA